MKMQERISHINDSRIFYREAGTGSPVILIHGLSGSGRWWQQNIDFLARSHHVYVVDLVGFGRSCRQRFQLAAAADLLAKWMDQLGIAKAALIGHSMGGFISIDLASSYPEKVDRLVIVDAPALPLDRNRARTALRLIRTVLEMPRPFLPILFSDGWQAGPRTVCLAAHELLRSDISHKLNNVHVPTLVIWGDRDWLVPVTLGIRLYDHLPSADFFVLDHAGHNPMWDRPDLFNPLVENFLQTKTFVSPNIPVNSSAPIH